jgi:hypothetical protein
VGVRNRALRVALSVVGLVLTSCGGHAQVAQNVASSAGAPSATGGATATGGSGGQDSDVTAAGNAGAPDSEAGAPNSDDAGAPFSLDPNACGLAPYLSSCSISAADVACNVDTDCTTLALPRCDCSGSPTPYIGVSTRSSASCAAPPCEPACDPFAQPFLVQVCDNQPCHPVVGASCVQHQCLSVLEAIGNCE